MPTAVRPFSNGITLAVPGGLFYALCVLTHTRSLVWSNE